MEGGQGGGAAERVTIYIGIYICVCVISYCILLLYATLHCIVVLCPYALAEGPNWGGGPVEF